MTRRIIHEELTDAEKFDNYLKEYNYRIFWCFNVDP